VTKRIQVAVVLTAYTRIDYRPVDIVADQPAHRTGAIFPDAAEKARRSLEVGPVYYPVMLSLCLSQVRRSRRRGLSKRPTGYVSPS